MHHDSEVYLAVLEEKAERTKQDGIPDFILNSNQQIHEEIYEFVKAHAEGVKGDKFIFQGALINFDYPEITIDPLVEPMNPYVKKLVDTYINHDFTDGIKLEGSRDWYYVSTYLMNSPLFTHLGHNYFLCTSLADKPFYISLAVNDTLLLLNEEQMEFYMNTYREMLDMYDKLHAA